MVLLEGNWKNSVTMCLCDQQIEDTEEWRKAKGLIGLLFPGQLAKLIKAMVI